jgi:hypothetical protein
MITHTHVKETINVWHKLYLKTTFWQFHFSGRTEKKPYPVHPHLDLNKCSFRPEQVSYWTVATRNREFVSRNLTMPKI